MIDGLDIGFSSDELALSGILRGRTLCDTFEDVVLGRDVYQVAAKRNPTRAFIHQQHAIYEYSHRRGDLDIAQSAIDIAAEMEPKNASIRHTKAEVLRRRAFETTSEFARRTYRSRARSELDLIADQNNAYVLSSRARLHVDDVADLLGRPGDPADDALNEEIAASVDRAEISLRRALNMYPNDADVLAANAKFKELLGDKRASTQLLEKAWQKMPRGSGVARTLALRYFEANQIEKWKSVLLEALDRDPTDRSIHLLLAELLFRQTKDLNNSEAEQHQKRSYVAGDREYYARYVSSAYAFARFRYDECFDLVDDIEKRAPADFKPSFSSLETWLGPAMEGRSGMVTKNFGSYMFVKVRDCPREVYAPSSRTPDNDWDSIRVHGSVVFNVSFSRKGPVAVALRRLD
jgi:tetratricopeptide (TPR) repeat protein